MNHSGPSEFFTTITFEFAGDASLSWYLSREERDQLKGGMADQEKKRAIQLLKQHLAIQD